MATYTEATNLGDLLKREFEPIYNRESVTLITGQNLTLGAVLGKITASGKYTAVAPSASDGSQTAAAVLLADVDATSADKKAVILARGPAVVSSSYLVWPDGATTNQKAAATAQLAALGIVARTAI